MSLEIKGTIKKIGELETFPSGFQKRMVLVTTDETYPQDLPVDFTQSASDMPEQYKEGEQVKVSINLRSNSWTNPQGQEKHFPSINGWRIERLEDEGNAKAEPSGKVPTATPHEAFGHEKKSFAEETDEDLEDSLPF